MEGLEPIVDWLNQQPSLDWKDYVHSEVSNVPQIHPLMDAVDPGPDDHRLDWLWDSNLDIAQQPQVTVDESEWQREVQALKEENARLRERVDSLDAGLEEYRRNHKRLAQLEQQAMAMMKWSAEVSAAVNNIQLQQEGLSPLQRHFGTVLGVRLRKGA